MSPKLPGEPRTYEKVIRLRKKGYTAAEIAGTLEISLSSVLKHIEKWHQHLREEMLK